MTHAQRSESKEENFRWTDALRLVLVPVGVTLGSPALAWMASFGQNPPTLLPLAALVFLGALLADAVARSLMRSLQRSLPFLSLGIVLAVAVAIMAFSPRDLVVVAGLLPVAAVLVLIPSRWGVMLGAMSVYTVATLLANYTLDAFLPFGPWFLVNVGTLFFGITFTQRDRVHRYGRPAVYAMILVAAIANVLAALALATPLRFVAVSFLAILVSEAADTEIYQRLLARRWWVRVASSNAVSAPIDTTLFTVLAFAGAPFATITWMLQVITTDIVVKYASGAVAALTLLRGRNAVDPPLPPSKPREPGANRNSHASAQL